MVVVELMKFMMIEVKDECGGFMLPHEFMHWCQSMLKGWRKRVFFQIYILREKNSEEV